MNVKIIRKNLKSKPMDTLLLNKEIECLKRKKELTNKLLSDYILNLRKTVIEKYKN